MTIRVSKDVESTIDAAVRSGRFASSGEMVDELVREYAERREQPPGAEPPSPVQSGPSGRKPLWERAAELRRSIPEAEWDNLPPGGARQLDHYLYGSPKRAEA